MNYSIFLSMQEQFIYKIIVKISVYNAKYIIEFI